MNDRSTELELLYIDDLIEGMYDLMEGKEAHCEYPKAGERGPEDENGIMSLLPYDGVNPAPCKSGRFCYVPVTHKATLGEIVDILEQFKQQPTTLLMPKMPKGSFAKKLYSL